NFAAPPSTLGPALGTAAGQFQPGQPLSFTGSSAFGTMTSMVERSVGLGTNRQIQFALRLNFQARKTRPADYSVRRPFVSFERVVRADLVAGRGEVVPELATNEIAKPSLSR